MTNVCRFKSLGEVRLAWFERARKSLGEALSVVEENFKHRSVTAASKSLLANDLYHAALMAKERGFIVPWYEENDTLYVLTFEGKSAVYIPAIFYSNK